MNKTQQLTGIMCKELNEAWQTFRSIKPEMKYGALEYVNSKRLLTVSGPAHNRQVALLDLRTGDVQWTMEKHDTRSTVCRYKDRLVVDSLTLVEVPEALRIWEMVEAGFNSVWQTDLALD